jgi:hypothetical protein
MLPSFEPQLCIEPVLDRLDERHAAVIASSSHCDSWTDVEQYSSSARLPYAAGARRREDQLNSV